MDQSQGADINHAREAMIYPRTLKGRLTLAFILVVACASILVTALALSVVNHETRKLVGTQQYAQLSSAARYLEANLAAKRILLRIIAETLPPVALTGNLPVQQVLERHRSLRDGFYNIVIFNASGVIVANLENPKSVGYGGFAQRDYFQETLRLRKGVTSRPLLSQISGKPTILITEPIMDASGRVVFVISGSIDLDNSDFFGQIARLKAGNSGYLFAFTRDGLVLHHPDRKRLLKDIRQEEGSAVQATLSAMEGWEGWTMGLDEKKLPAVLTYKQMQESAWILGSVYSSDEAFASTQKARYWAWAGTVIIAMLAGGLGWAITRRLLAPLGLLTRHVESVGQGKAEIDVANMQVDDEIGALAHAFHSMWLKRKAAEAHLKKLSMTDTLTGLGNRRQLTSDLKSAIKRATRRRYSLTVAYLDIDKFKSINDEYGHAIGDVVLKEFAKRLNTALRGSDRAYRLSGDEFILLLDGHKSKNDATTVAAKIVALVQSPIHVEGRVLMITTSIGITMAWPPFRTGEVILANADAALYDTKKRSRNGYTFKELGTPVKSSSLLNTAT